MQNRTAFLVATTPRTTNVLCKNARTVTRKQISSLATMRTHQLFYAREKIRTHNICYNLYNVITLDVDVLKKDFKNRLGH